jgi:hypothetical protein
MFCGRCIAAQERKSVHSKQHNHHFITQLPARTPAPARRANLSSFSFPLFHMAQMTVSGRL